MLVRTGFFDYHDCAALAELATCLSLRLGTVIVFVLNL